MNEIWQLQGSISCCSCDFVHPILLGYGNVDTSWNPSQYIFNVTFEKSQLSWYVINCQTCCVLKIFLFIVHVLYYNVCGWQSMLTSFYVIHFELSMLLLNVGSYFTYHIP